MKFAPEMKFIGYELSRIGAQLKLHWTAERFQCTLEETCPNVNVLKCKLVPGKMSDLAQVDLAYVPSMKTTSC